MNYCPASCLNACFARALSNLNVEHVYQIVTMIVVKIGDEWWCSFSSGASVLRGERMTC